MISLYLPWDVEYSSKSPEFEVKYNFLKNMVFETEWLCLGLGAKNQKSKGTFFSPTFKVQEKKVPLFSPYFAPGPRYSHSDSENISFQ